MSDHEIDWTHNVANPESIGEADKDQWVQIEPILRELLDELGANDKLETVIPLAEARALQLCLTKLNLFNEVHNFLIHLTDSKERADSFLDATARFGLTETLVTSNYTIVAFSISVLQTEFFKLVLLFHMKNVDHRVSAFPRTIQECAPVTWKKLEPWVDSPLRNSLAHGAYAITNGRVILYDDAKLIPIQEMDLGEYMMRNKKQGVLLQCLYYVLEQKGLFALRFNRPNSPGHAEKA